MIADRTLTCQTGAEPGNGILPASVGTRERQAGNGRQAQSRTGTVPKREVLVTFRGVLDTLVLRWQGFVFF